MQDYKIEPSFSEDYHIYVIGGCFWRKWGQNYNWLWDRQRECPLGKENVKGWNKLEWQHNILIIQIETKKPFQSYWTKLHYIEILVLGKICVKF